MSRFVGTPNWNTSARRCQKSWWRANATSFPPCHHDDQDSITGDSPEPDPSQVPSSINQGEIPEGEEPLVTRELGLEMKKRIGAEEYIECSA